MHRKIYALLADESLEQAIKTALDAFDTELNTQDGYMTDGTIQPLAGEYTQVKASTYFPHPYEQAGFKLTSPEAQALLHEAYRALDNGEYGMGHIFYMISTDSTDPIIESKTRTEQGCQRMIETLHTKENPIWVIPFDYRV